MKPKIVKVDFNLPVILLGLLLVMLKLTDKIDWSWWIVLAPFWVGPVVVLSIIVVPFALIVIAAAFLYMLKFLLTFGGLRK